MSTSMITICFLLLSTNYAWCNLSNTNNLVECDDCISILECKEATAYRTDLTVEKINFINSNFCAIKKSIYVCCSKFKVGEVISAGELTSPKPLPEEFKHPNLKLLPESCGYVNDITGFRIYSGSMTTLYEFPWMVLIPSGPANEMDFKCSGTLINSRYVLTAAHCIGNFVIQNVRIGEYHIGEELDCNDNVCDSNFQDIDVEEIIRHKHYSARNYYINDIALLRLAVEVDMTWTKVAPICLPTTWELQHDPITTSITNKTCTVTGWGLTEHNRTSSVLLKVEIPILSNDECRTHYSHIPASDPTLFCAGGRFKDSCKGDSGGPLTLKSMYKGQYRPTQYGIVSNGPLACGAGVPGLYTDVRKYVKWILDNIRE